MYVVILCIDCTNYEYSMLSFHSKLTKLSLQGENGYARDSWEKERCVASSYPCESSLLRREFIALDECPPDKGVSPRAQGTEVTT